MYNYRIYCMEVQSDIEFPQLVRSEGCCMADVTICRGDIGRKEGAPYNVNYEIGASFSWLENKTCCLWIENGSRITYRLKEGGSKSYLLTYILGWGLAMLAYQRNELAMHCSVVCDDGGAVLICGESGCGKSTVTTSFLQHGYSFMADDMAYVCVEDNIPYVKPAFPYQKLCRDAAVAGGSAKEDMIYIDEMKDKYLVPYRGKFIDDKVKVKLMVVLYRCEGEEVVCSDITGIDKIHACLGNLFLRKLLKAQIYAPATGALGLKAAGQIPMYGVGRPDGRDTRREVMEKVLALL